MNQHTALKASIELMQTVIDVAPIDRDALAGPTPCEQFTVRELGEHIIDNHNLFFAATDGQLDDVGGTLSQRHGNVGALASAQWSSRGTDGFIELGGNEVPAEFAFSLHTLESYIHAWDLAASLGRPFDPPAELTGLMTDFAEKFITDDLRGSFEGAPYKTAFDLPDDASEINQLIAFTGRNPSWQRYTGT